MDAAALAMGIVPSLIFWWVVFRAMPDEWQETVGWTLGIAALVLTLVGGIWAEPVLGSVVVIAGVVWVGFICWLAERFPVTERPSERSSERLKTGDSNGGGVTGHGPNRSYRIEPTQNRTEHDQGHVRVPVVPPVAATPEPTNNDANIDPARWAGHAVWRRRQLAAVGRAGVIRSFEEYFPVHYLRDMRSNHGEQTVGSCRLNINGLADCVGLPDWTDTIAKDRRSAEARYDSPVCFSICLYQLNLYTDALRKLRRAGVEHARELYKTWLEFVVPFVNCSNPCRTHGSPISAEHFLSVTSSDIFRGVAGQYRKLYRYEDGTLSAWPINGDRMSELTAGIFGELIRESTPVFENYFLQYADSVTLPQDVSRTVLEEVRKHLMHRSLRWHTVRRFLDQDVIGVSGVATAAYLNDQEHLEKLVTEGVDVRSTSITGDTALHWARDIHLAKWLLGKGADPNASNCIGATPLHGAVVRDDLELAASLIGFGATINSKMSGGISPLHLSPGVDVTQFLLHHHADVQVRDDLGQQPLHLTEDVEVARLLLANGADPDARTALALTPLHLVTNSAMMKLLVESGADVLAKTSDGETVLHFAAKRQDLALCKLLCGYGVQLDARSCNGETALSLARSSELIDFFVGLGANLEAAEGNTALHFAVEDGDRFEVERLLRAAYDINAKNGEGQTPLHMAMDLEVARLLLESGAHVDAQDEEGQTPLHLAIMDDDSQLLLDHGANINATDCEGCTPLHTAMVGRHYDYAAFLLRSGADRSIANAIGQTPLHILAQDTGDDVMWWAVREQLEETTSLPDASLDARDTDGKSAMYYAVLNANVALVEFLIDHGAEVDLGYLPEVRETALGPVGDRRRIDMLLRRRGGLWATGWVLASSVPSPQHLSEE